MVDGVIVLYDQNETSFTSNGLGYLPDATECTVIEELNGEFELEMEYPITGKRYDQIQHRRILYVKTNPYEDPQPFRIYNINKPIDGLVEVNARHISYDLSGYALPWISNGEGEKSDLPFATGPASAVENLPALVNQLNTGMQPFTYWTNSTEDYPRDPDPAHEKENELKEPHWIFIDTPTTARNLLGKFTEKYKGEFKFDKFNVKFYGPVSGQSEDDTHYRGKDSGVVLRYGKNLTDLMQEEDSDKGMYTHIYPFWSGSIDVQNESEYSSSTTKSKETVIELPDKLYPVNSSVDPGYKRIYVYDVTSDYTDELKSKDGLGYPSEETLKEMCDKLIKENKLGTPNITLTASFVQLSKSVEYSNLALLEKILLGDTVTVDFPKLDVKSTLKCTAIEYNVLTDEYKTITLGDERNTSGGVSSTIASTASLSASNSTAIAGSATKQDVFGKSYDTALSLTSENAVQNKVVTGAFNNANDAITLLKSQYSTLSREIQELIESGSKVTFGTTTPENSMGDDGEIYVKIKSTAGGGYAIVAVYYKYEGVWLANSNKEILTGTIPPTQSTGDNDNVYIDFKYSSLEDYKLTKVWDCGGGWYGGFDLTVNKTAADQPTAFLFDGAYQQSVSGCNEWYIELSDLTPGDVITISFDYQMIQQNPNFDITPYIATDKWYQHGICVLGVEDPNDSRIWYGDDKVKYGWSETSGFLSVHQDWNLHSYEFDYTVESSKVYIYFNWQGWTRNWEPISIYDPPRKLSINITNFTISQKVKTIVGIDNVYYKYEGKWWQDDAQQYKGDFIKDIASNISTGTVIANAINKNDVSIPIRVPYGVQSISPNQVIGQQTPIATITNDDGTTQTLYAPAGGGGGGGGSAIGLTLLYDVGTFPDPTSGSGNVDRDLTLTDNINNYDAVYIIATPYVTGTGANKIQGTYVTMTILKSDYYPPCGETYESTNRWVFMLNGSWGGNNRRVVFRFSDDGTQILAQDRRDSSDFEPMIYRVYGLTFGGGGSSLPSGGTTGQALVKQSGTDYDADWDDIIQVPSGGSTGQVLGKISGTDYDIGWINQSGGGGSGFEQTLLYSTQSTSSPNTITLSESWENFDAIYLIVESDNFLMEALYLKEDLVSGYRIGSTSDIGFCWYNITNDPTSLTKQSATSGYFIKTIRGIKFGSGGGGGGGRTYLGDLTPRVSATSANITSSSYSTSYGTFYDWYAFNGVSPSSYRDPQGNCWQGVGTNQWIQYHFAEPRYFTEIELKCFSNYSGDWVGNIKVEGSSDGTNFTNILASGTTQQITAELAPTSEGGSGQESDILISLDDTEVWSYIRVTFVENMSVSYSPSCFIDEIYVYGGKEGSSGSDDYSTAETRIGTWIDGKPLYRKVATLTLNHTGTYSSTYLHNWAHGIQNVDTCVSATGYVVDDNGDHIMFGFYVTYSVFISVIFNTTNVNFRYSSGLDGKTCTFVLEYTKTTD